VFNGLRLLVTNWRLTLVEILPAMWVWLAMFDLKAHVLPGKSFTALRGPVLIPLGLLIIALTVASFFLNAVFAFAVSHSGRPEVRSAVTQARQHLHSGRSWPRAPSSGRCLPSRRWSLRAGASRGSPSPWGSWSA
jgi:hypothetical protein